MHKTIISALALDYGGVISQVQQPQNVKNILRILDLDQSSFSHAYFSKRDEYDNGQLSGRQYWASVLRHNGIEKNDAMIDRLIQEDVESWTRINDAMIRFIEKSRQKLPRLAIISNMSRDTLAYIRRHFQWPALFDELTFSCDVGVNKPDRLIYQHCLNRLEVPPKECLFVDDSAENVDGALNVGMQGIHYQTFAQFEREFGDNFRNYGRRSR